MAVLELPSDAALAAEISGRLLRLSAREYTAVRIEMDRLEASMLWTESAIATFNEAFNVYVLEPRKAPALVIVVEQASGRLILAAVCDRPPSSWNALTLCARAVGVEIGSSMTFLPR